MAQSGSTAIRKRLAQRLRQLREEAGITNEEVAQQIDWLSRAKLSRIENNQQRIQPDEVEDLLDLYGAKDETIRNDLKLMAKQARQRGWWQQPGHALPEDFRDYVGMEAVASRIYWFELALVPALLQTPEYARAVIAGMDRGIGPDELERRVKSRMLRQQVLNREDDPLELWAILHEGVLTQPIGAPDVMRGQLRHLLEMARRPNITLQVVPKKVGAYPGFAGWFCLLEFPDPDEPDMGYTDGVGGNIYLEDPEDVRGCTLLFGDLRGIALSPTKSVAMIKSVVDDLSRELE